MNLIIVGNLAFGLRRSKALYDNNKISSVNYFTTVFFLIIGIAISAFCLTSLNILPLLITTGYIYRDKTVPVISYLGKKLLK